MNAYTLVLMFSNDHKRVALIQKKRPSWQKGFLNGIGGVMKDDVAVLSNDKVLCKSEAVRHFKKETGFSIDEEELTKFAHMVGENFDKKPFSVACYACTGPIDKLKSVDEKITILPVMKLPFWGKLCIRNISWLVPLALDTLKTGNPPRSAIIDY